MQKLLSDFRCWLLPSDEAYENEDGEWCLYTSRQKRVHMLESLILGAKRVFYFLLATVYSMSLWESSGSAPIAHSPIVFVPVVGQVWWLSKTVEITGWASVYVALWGLTLIVAVMPKFFYWLQTGYGFAEIMSISAEIRVQQDQEQRKYREILADMDEEIAKFKPVDEDGNVIAAESD